MTETQTIEQAQAALRDLFAMAALAGLLACPDRSGHIGDYADKAFRFADAMMVARGGFWGSVP